MDETKEAGTLSIQLDHAWSRRVKAVREWNARIDSGDLQPGHLRRIIWAIKSSAAGSRYHESFAELERHWRTVSGKKTPSLAWTLNDVFGHMFWIGGAFKVGSFLSAGSNECLLIVNLRFLVIHHSLWDRFSSK